MTAQRWWWQFLPWDGHIKSALNLNKICLITFQKSIIKWDWRARHVPLPFFIIYSILESIPSHWLLIPTIAFNQMMSSLPACRVGRISHDNAGSTWAFVQGKNTPAGSFWMYWVSQVILDSVWIRYEVPKLRWSCEKTPHSLGFAGTPLFRIALSSVQTLGGVERVLDFESEVTDSSTCLWNFHDQLCNLKKCLLLSQFPDFKNSDSNICEY